MKRTLLVCLVCFCLFPPAAMGKGPDFTPEEQAWLAAHDGSIRLALAPNWEPLEF